MQLASPGQANFLSKYQLYPANPHCILTSSLFLSLQVNRYFCLAALIRSNLQGMQCGCPCILATV